MTIELDGQIITIIILSIACIALYLYNNQLNFQKPYRSQQLGHNVKKYIPYNFKKEDDNILNNPLQYPYTRLPNRIIDQYKRSGFYESGAFGNATNYFGDSEKIVGNLIAEPNSNISALPLFEKASGLHRDRYFYYTIDTRLSNNYKIKIPMNNLIINGKIRKNIIDNGIDEIMDGDEIEILDHNFPPGTIFTAKLYPKQSGLYYDPNISNDLIVGQMSH